MVINIWSSLTRPAISTNQISINSRSIYSHQKFLNKCTLSNDHRQFSNEPSPCASKLSSLNNFLFHSARRMYLSILNRQPTQQVSNSPITAPQKRFWSLVRHDNRSVISISGPDRYTFIQGLTTNDINSILKTEELDPNSYTQFSAMLNSKGRVIGDLMFYSYLASFAQEAYNPKKQRVTNNSVELNPEFNKDRLYFDCCSINSQAISNILLRYKLRKKVGISFLDAYYVPVNIIPHLSDIAFLNNSNMDRVLFERTRQFQDNQQSKSNVKNIEKMFPNLGQTNSKTVCYIYDEKTGRKKLSIPKNYGVTLESEEIDGQTITDPKLIDSQTFDSQNNQKNTRSFDLSQIDRYILPAKLHTNPINDKNVISRQNQFIDKYLNQFLDPRSIYLGYRLLVPINQYDQLLDLFPQSDASDYKHIRYRLGLCENKDEYGVVRAIPAEYNLNYYNAISFNKGCYVGQELTARVHYLGKVRKSLFPFFIYQDSSSLTVDNLIDVNSKKNNTDQAKENQSHSNIGDNLYDNSDQQVSQQLHDREAVLSDMKEKLNLEYDENNRVTSTIHNMNDVDVYDPETETVVGQIRGFDSGLGVALLKLDHFPKNPNTSLDKNSTDDPSNELDSTNLVNKTTSNYFIIPDLPYHYAKFDYPLWMLNPASTTDN